MGIEPTSEAWEASILPLNYARVFNNFILALSSRMLQKLFSFYRDFSPHADLFDS